MRMERATSSGDSSPPPPLGVRSSSSPISARAEESFDFRGYPPQSEWEECPSLRWLPSGLRFSAARGSERWSEGYVSLCRHGKVDDRRIFPSKDPCSVKDCFFMPAGGLLVREDKDQIWLCTNRIKHGDRSWHAVQLVEGYYLDIRGTIDTTTLPSDTEYAVYLLFKFTGESLGFVMQEASLEIGSQSYKQNICLQPGYGVADKYSKAKMPNEPVNGWLSIEMGRFSTCKGENMSLFISLTEGRRMDPCRKTGGIVPDKKGLIIGGVIVEPTLMDHAKKFVCLMFSLSLLSSRKALHKASPSSS